MNKLMNMTYSSSLTNLCEANSSFDTGVLRICYTGENRNKSFLSKETIEKCIPSIYNCPIVCNYDRDTDTLGGHDMELIQRGDDLQIVNLTQPVGIIPESAKVWFDDYEEEDGTVHEYLFAEALLWKRQEAYKKIKNDGISAHSMEISVKDGKTVDGIYHISDFEFNAFALIGETPCFEGSALEMFVQDNFETQMHEMLKDLKETFTSIIPSKEDDNILQNYSTKGGKETLEGKLDLIDNRIDDSYALNKNIIDEIMRALGTEKAKDNDGFEYQRYHYVDCDIEIGEVYCWDCNDWILYGFAFAMDGDSVVIDFDSKKRKKYVVTDFVEGEQASSIAAVVKPMIDKLDEYSELESKYTQATETISSMQSEIDSLKEFKHDTEMSIAKNEREEVFAMFEDLAGIVEYETLKENCMDYDLETLEEKCFAIRGKNSSALKFSSKESTPKLKVTKVDMSKEPYGGLIEKYAGN